MDFSAVAEIYRAYKSRDVSTELHPNDVMYRTGAAHYYVTGEMAIETILRGLTFSGATQVRRVLDLACGHGRIARHLAIAFPDAEMFYCDINPEYADFCAKHFNGVAIHSQPDLTKVELPKGLDLIWVGSLFTHIDRQKTQVWLQFLSDHLRGYGNLVATFHGFFSEKVTDFGDRVDREKLSREFFATGYGYSRSLDWEDYGVSLSKPSAILDMADAIPNTKVIAYTERGWANNHDVLTLTKDDRLRPWGTTHPRAPN
jgi:SAM-dependent methyltransferase